MTQTTGNSGAVTGAIDQIQLPYETELRRYVVADDVVSNLTNNAILYLNNLNYLAGVIGTGPTLLLNPATWSTLYTSGLLTTLGTTLTALLTTDDLGMADATADAIWNKARSRANIAGARAARRITEEISKRLPYAGMIADALAEADIDTALALNETNNDILIKQADLTYQQNRAKIKEAMEFEAMLAANQENQMNRGIKAYGTYDANNIEKYKAYVLAAIDQCVKYIDALLAIIKEKAASPDQITFENWLRMSKIMADGQLNIAALVSNLQGV